MIPSLSWMSHTKSICSNASRTRGYLRRNLKNASPEVGKTSLHNVHSTEIGVFIICLASITVLPHHWLKNNSEPYCTFYNIKPWKRYQYHTIKIITKTTDTHLTQHHLMTMLFTCLLLQPNISEPATKTTIKDTFAYQSQSFYNVHLKPHV